MNKVLIIIADIEEFVPFEGFMNTKGAMSGEIDGYKTVIGELSGWNIIAVHSGVGKVNAATAAAYFIATEKPALVLNFGLAGAVSRVLRGDIVAGKSFVECDFDLSAVGLEPGVKPQQQQSKYSSDMGLLLAATRVNGVKTGAIGTGDIFLTDKTKRDEYREQFGICAFDMESAAIASVCCRFSVPFLALKKISDNADDTALSEYREMNTSGELHLSDIVQKTLYNAARI